MLHPHPKKQYKNKLMLTMFRHISLNSTNSKDPKLEEQQDEVNYLLAHKQKIMSNVASVYKSDAQILEDHFNMLVATSEYSKREQCLEVINLIIIRGKINASMSYSRFELNCNNCYLTRFPNQLLVSPEYAGYWANLTTLVLSNNRLRCLPPIIGKCNNLKIFYADNNQLENFPFSLWSCKNLHTLNLDNNRVESFPPEIQRLKALKYLSVKGNQLRYLPESMRDMTLERLYVEGNSLEELPQFKSGFFRDIYGKVLSNQQVLDSQKLNIFAKPRSRL